MRIFLPAKMHRRDVFRAAAAAVAVAASGTATGQAGAAQPADSSNRRRARYPANSPEVQNFYRVNRYPARREK
jgi:hypothetical protein